MEANRYPPVEPRTKLKDGERHLHSFLIRALRYAMLLPEPAALTLTGHFTDLRLLLEPEPAGEPVSVAWNDIIEFEQIAGSRAAEEFPGAEDHMIHAVTRNAGLLSASEFLLFTAEPTTGAHPLEQPGHCAAFLEIAEEMLLAAFEGDA